MSRLAHSARSHAAGSDAGFQLIDARFIAAPVLLWGAAMLAVVVSALVVAAPEPASALAPAVGEEFVSSAHGA